MRIFPTGYWHNAIVRSMPAIAVGNLCELSGARCPVYILPFFVIAAGATYSVGVERKVGFGNW